MDFILATNVNLNECHSLDWPDFFLLLSSLVDVFVCTFEFLCQTASLRRDQSARKHTASLRWITSTLTSFFSFFALCILGTRTCMYMCTLVAFTLMLLLFSTFAICVFTSWTWTLWRWSCKLHYILSHQHIWRSLEFIACWPFRTMGQSRYIWWMNLTRPATQFISREHPVWTNCSAPFWPIRLPICVLFGV